MFDSNAGAEQAMSWLLEHGDDADIDAPLEDDKPATAGGDAKVDVNPESVRLCYRFFLHAIILISLSSTLNNNIGCDVVVDGLSRGKGATRVDRDRRRSRARHRLDL
jgi:uncharacterized UBP type Zn finger protein